MYQLPRQLNTGIGRCTVTRYREWAQAQGLLAGDLPTF
jgi:hypothetical protein